MKTRSRILVLALAVVAIAGWGTFEVAGQVQEPVPVPTYSGCLSKDGTFYGFSADANGECEDGDAEASLSSGDVTEVAGGEGVTGGAKSGPATLRIETGYRLPQDCGQGDSITYEGEDWGCLEPLDPSAFAKSDQTCPPGRVASGIDLLGNLVCVEQAQAGGPSTDWVGVVTLMTRTPGSRISLGPIDTENNIYVYNPNAQQATMTARAFDSGGDEEIVDRPGIGDCTGVRIPSGGIRSCSVVPGALNSLGVVVVHADLPVLPFGRVIPSAPRTSWELDWYPFCPEHVGTCND